jgi:hypothetical protein
VNEVRRDRKFVLSLELHREIARHLVADPELVRRRGLEGAAIVRPRARSFPARERVDAWSAMLERRDWDAVRACLLGEDEDAVEMRNMTVFLNIIPDERRREIIDEVLARPGLLA